MVDYFLITIYTIHLFFFFGGGEGLTSQCLAYMWGDPGAITRVAHEEGTVLSASGRK